MKVYLKIVAFVVLVSAVLIALFLLHEASKPESAIIAAERKKLILAADQHRGAGSPNDDRSLVDKILFLDYRLALAYNKENRPDDAIAVLNELIKTEEAKGQKGGPRHSRNYRDEARYYDALIASFEIKHDEGNAKKAERSRDELMAKSRVLKKQEESEEGKSVGLGAK